MANKDLITEQILSIEDFNNVDAGLMRIIESNEEYRRIFEDYKEISALTSECVPEPVKNGVSLHDAVMDRVKSGDTAPRYTATNKARKFMFPMATAASLAIVLVAAITATVATRTRNNMDIPLQLEEDAYISDNISDQNAEFAPAPGYNLVEKHSTITPDNTLQNSDNNVPEEEKPVTDGSTDDDRTPDIVNDETEQGKEEAEKENASQSGSGGDNVHREDSKKPEASENDDITGKVDVKEDVKEAPVKGNDKADKPVNAQSEQPSAPTDIDDDGGSFVSAHPEETEEPSVPVEPPKTEEPSVPVESPKPEQPSAPTEPNTPPSVIDPGNGNNTNDSAATENGSAAVTPPASTENPPITDNNPETDPVTEPNTPESTGNTESGGDENYGDENYGDENYGDDVGTGSSNENNGESGESGDGDAIMAAITERLEKALQHPDYNGELITPELIDMFGAELFIEWFDSIIGSPDFGELYTVDEYINYCLLNGF